MKRIKQLICRHDYEYLARHRDTMQNLWRCRKCGIFYIQHWGIGTGGKSRTPVLDNWIYEEGGSHETE